MAMTNEGATRPRTAHVGNLLRSPWALHHEGEFDGAGQTPLQDERVISEPSFVGRCMGRVTGPSLTVRRMLGAVAISAVFLILTAGPAAAKMPGFTIEVETEANIAIVTVRVGGVGSSQLAAEGFNPFDVDGLVAIYPADSLDDQGRPTSHVDAIPVNLLRVEDWIYRAEVAIDISGRWALVPFPTSVTFDPAHQMYQTYPQTTFFDIGLSRAGLWTRLVAGIGVLSIAMLLYARRSRRVAPVVPTVLKGL